MKITEKLFILFLGLAILIPGSPSSVGQTPPPAAAQNPHHDVSVTLKLIQVYVTDKKGNPAPGLTAADFEITDDGKPVSITDIEYHAAVIPGATDNTPTATTPAAPVKINRKFFLWIDFGFNDPKGARRAKAAGLHFMDSQIQPQDDVALLTSTSLKGMTVQEYLTKDHAKMRKEIEAVEVGRIVGRASEIELLMSPEHEGARSIDQGNPLAKNFPGDEDSKRLVQIEGASAQLIYKQQALRFLQDFRDIAKALRYIPGAKSLILFSGGIARSLLFGTKGARVNFNPYGDAEEQARYNDAVLTQYGDRDIQSEFHDLVRELRASNTFIYAVNETLPQGASHDRAAMDFQGDEFLRQLAGETGGQYFHNTQDTDKAVEDIQKLTASYYVLGYPVSEKWDGLYRAVKVTLKRKDLQCWGTAGYFNPKPFSELTPTEKRLHFIDLVLSDSPQGQTPSAMPFKAIPVYRGGGPSLAVVARVPRDSGDAAVGPRTEAVLVLFDEQKNLKGIKRAELVLTKNDGDRIILSGLLPIPPGHYTCRIILRDLDSGKSARATADVNVPAPAFAGLSVSPPLWLTADTGASWKDLFSKDVLTSFYPFERTAYLPLLGDIGTETAKIYAVLPVSFFGVAKPEIALAAQLVEAATGKSRPLPLVVLKKTEDGHSETYFLELTTGPLPPGAYSLYLFVQDKNGFKKTFISTYQTR